MNVMRTYYAFPLYLPTLKLALCLSAKRLLLAISTDLARFRQTPANSPASLVSPPPVFSYTFSLSLESLSSFTRYS